MIYGVCVLTSHPALMSPHDLNHPGPSSLERQYQNLEYYCDMRFSHDWMLLLTVRGTVPATAVITLCDLLNLLRNGVDFCSRIVERTPAHVVGTVPTLATYPAPAELFEEAELVGALGLGVYGCCICGVVAGGGDPGCSIEMSGHAVVVGD